MAGKILMKAFLYKNTSNMLSNGGVYSQGRLNSCQQYNERDFWGKSVNKLPLNGIINLYYGHFIMTFSSIAKRII
jgi:hypothetical protein